MAEFLNLQYFKGNQWIIRPHLLLDPIKLPEKSPLFNLEMDNGQTILTDILTNSMYDHLRMGRMIKIIDNNNTAVYHHSKYYCNITYNLN